MTFEGSNVRKLTGQKSLSFLLNKLNISNLTGDAYFGFSGEGQTFQFKFEKGKIYDPDNNYVYSYYPSQGLVLSGDISDDYYNYSINEKSIVRGKTKNDFKLENFFINTSNCSLNANLSIMTDGIDYAFELQDQAVVGDNISGQITNSSNDGKLHIFNATLKEDTDNNYNIVSFPTEVGYQGGTGDFVFDSVDATDGYHSFEMDLDTNVGKISIKDSIQLTSPDKTETSNMLKLFSSGTFNDLIFDNVNSEDAILFLYSSTIFGSPNTVQKVSPSLEYVEGNVGTYYRVTGVNIVNSGGGYTETPTVQFAQGQGNDVPAEGTAIMSGDMVVGVDVTNSGVYYDDSPDFLWFDGENTTPVDGQVETETYQKTFSECWDIYTGSSLNNFVSFKDGGLTGDQGDAAYDSQNHGPGIYETSNEIPLSNGENLYIKVKGKSFYDFDIIKAKLKITGTLVDTNTGNLSEEATISSQNTT